MDHLASKDLPELQRLIDGALEAIAARFGLVGRIESERLNSRTPSQKMERMLDDLESSTKLLLAELERARGHAKSLEAYILSTFVQTKMSFS